MFLDVGGRKLYYLPTWHWQEANSTELVQQPRKRKCGWHRQVQIQLAVPPSNADDTVKCSHSLPSHHQMWMTLSSANTAYHAINVEPSITSRVTSTAATHTWVKPKEHSARDSKHTNLDKRTGVGDHCWATGHSVSTNNTKVLTRESNWHKKKVKEANRTPSACHLQPNYPAEIWATYVTPVCEQGL